MPSDDIAISVRNLTKSYRLFGHPGDRIKQFLSLGLKQYHRQFTALHDVSFDIRKGETVGIIGRNGSGKSTLLQLICGILKPTQGTVKVNGRISALLELGAGFNPEFTGRENVYFQGALMGFSKEQMGARFDDVAAFADIGEFIDQPVRTYSSGMFVRLAFAVAIHADPDILIVDEALSVGDEGFQSKCIAKLNLFRINGGTTIFVTHSAQQIIQLCDQALLLEEGRLVATGAPKFVTDTYLSRLLDSARGEKRPVAHGPLPSEVSHGTIPSENFDPDLISYSTITYPESGARIISPEIQDLNGNRVNLLQTGCEYYYCYDVSFFEDAYDVRFAMMIKTHTGIELGGLLSASEGQGAIFRAGSTYHQKFRFRCHLLPSIYLLNAGVLGCVTGGRHAYLHRLIDAALFRVRPNRTYRSGGVVDFTSSKVE